MANQVYSDFNHNILCSKQYVASLQQCIEEYKKDKTSEHSLLEAFGDVFDSLLIDSNAPGNVYHLISDETAPSMVLEYANIINELQKIMIAIDDSNPYKQILLDRFYDNFNKKSVNEFNSGFSEDKEAAALRLIKQNEVDDILNTVEVRTWGTKAEYSNGLRSVIDKQIKGDDVGHASVTMKIAADDDGLALIKKYCLHDDGQVKIPYEIKKYNNKIIYEIYWSYWPGRINALKNDIEEERKGNEYKEFTHLEQTLPQELKDHYLLYKTRKRQSVTLAPASQNIIKDRMLTTEQEKYIQLKRDKYKMNEEISSIDVLLDNYLGKEKSFSPNKVFKDTEILNDSNFLRLLIRFKSQLGNNHVVSKIIKDKSISTNEAKLLRESVVSLLAKKEGQKDKLKGEIKLYGNRVQINRNEIKVKKSQIKGERSWLRFYSICRENKDKAEETQSFLSSQLDSSSYPITVPENLIKWIEDYSTSEMFLDEYEPIRQLSKDPLILDESQNQSLIKMYGCFIKSLKEKLKEQEKKSLSMDDVDGLHNLYRTLDKSNNESLSKMKDKILESEKKIEQLNEIINGYQAFDNFSSLDSKIKGIIKKISELERVKSYRGQEFQYEKNNETITVQLTSKEQSASIKNELKEHLTQLKAEIKIKKIKPSVDFKYNLEVNGVNQKRVAKKIPKDQAIKLKKQLLSNLDRLKEEEKVRINNKITSRIRSKKSTDELLKANVSRGLPYQSSVLKGFDIEAMLMKASELAETTKDFKLRAENCSTTSMKLLNAGVPEEQKSLFVWSQASGNEKYATNSFLTNPQSVYTSAKLFEGIHENNDSAVKMAKELKQSQKSRSTYHGLLNELASKDNEELSNTNNSWWQKALIVIQFFMSPSSVYFFIKDFFFIKTPVIEKEAPSLLVRVDEEIRKLSENKYLIIDSKKPMIAIAKMLDQLKESSENIPFFSRKTSLAIEQLMLSIEVKKELTGREQELLDNYKLIINERDERVEQVETAIKSGGNVKQKLAEKDSSVRSANWDLDGQEMDEYKLAVFVDAYQKEKKNQFLSFLSPGISHALSKNLSVDEKLSLIKNRIKTNPSSISAQVWRNVVAKNTLINEWGRNTLKRSNKLVLEHLVSTVASQENDGRSKKSSPTMQTDSRPLFLPSDTNTVHKEKTDKDELSENNQENKKSPH